MGSGGGYSVDRLQLAKQMAVEAGRFIKKRRAEEFVVETKGPDQDLVTQVDRESEQLIFGRIREAAPDDRWLGEEESFGHQDGLADRLERAKSEPYLWVVDPIDGTVNYVQNISGFTVSIALACYGEVVVGAVYDPLRDELFYAERGKGAFLNDRPISVSANETLRQSVVGTSIPSRDRGRELTLLELPEVSAKCHKIRSLGSAALHLSYVACGRLTAYWHHGLNAWDMAASALIIQEAGGRVTDLLTGGGYGLPSTDVLASNGRIHDELRSYLRPAP